MLHELPVCFLHDILERLSLFVLFEVRSVSKHFLSEVDLLRYTQVGYVWVPFTTFFITLRQPEEVDAR